tara:strand:+ start:529 stop:774 length:246 start_codon:yes stop_codon:yes gene_type:complete
MNGVSGFLSKFSQLLSEKKEKEQFIIDTIASVCHITLSEKDFRIKEDTIYITGSSALKNHLFLKKETLLPHFKEKGIREIR